MPHSRHGPNEVIQDKVGNKYGWKKLANGKILYYKEVPVFRRYKVKDLRKEVYEQLKDRSHIKKGQRKKSVRRKNK